MRASYNGVQNVSVTIADGPLPPGEYRLTLTDSILDTVGNALDGDFDGTPGGNFMQTFTVDPLPPNTVLEQPLNHARTSATPLTIDQDSTLSTFYSTETFGLGSQDPNGNNTWADEDWWSFEGEAGDHVSVTMVTPSSGVNAYVELYHPGGGYLTADDNGGPNQDALISGFPLTSTGTHYLRVGSTSASRGTYELRVGLSRGVAMETDVQYHNDSLGNADGFALSQDGALRSGSIVGLIQGAEGTNQDEDRYNLGILTAGNTVELNLTLPGVSTLDGRVFLVDSNGNIVPDEDGDTSNGVYRTTLTQDGTYYADVRANSGAGPNGYYQLDASLGDAQPPVVRSVSRLALPGPDERVYSDTIGSLNPSIYLPLDETSGADAIGCIRSWGSGCDVDGCGDLWCGECVWHEFARHRDRRRCAYRDCGQ